jgi:hypothetical protein
MPAAINVNARPWKSWGGSPNIAADKSAVKRGMKLAKKAATVGPALLTPNPQQR